MALPFQPDDPSFNRANALYLAHASDVAYHRTPPLPLGSGWVSRRSRSAAKRPVPEAFLAFVTPMPSWPFAAPTQSRCPIG